MINFTEGPQDSLNPLPDNKILDWSKLKQSADDNFQFDVKSKNFSKLVENTVEIGEIAWHEQFLLFPQCFQKACFPGASKGVIVWKWVNTWSTGTSTPAHPINIVSFRGDIVFLFLAHVST